MATLTEWTLPLNPPNFQPLYLQYLTQPRAGTLYYTKYIIDYIGELHVERPVQNIREWKIPAPLFAGPSGSPSGITHGPGRRIWFALEQGHRLVEFDPKSGDFTSYGGALYPFPYPRHLMFDSRRALWCTGKGAQGGLVARLSPNRTSARYWELPVDLLSPEGLWVEASGEAVWFTSINTNLNLTGAFLARLDPALSQLRYWTYNPGRRPVNAGVIGEPPVKPDNVWFTYDAWGPSSRVYRLHVPNGTFFEYASKFSAPRKLALDASGAAWISDWTGQIRRLARDADCGIIDFNASHISVSSGETELQPRHATARPRIMNSSPLTRTVNPVDEGCYLNFAIPSLGARPNGIALDGGPGAALPDVYFSESGLNTIGRLQP